MKAMKIILLLEDDPYEAQMVIRVMEHQGYQVLHALDGTSGLQMALEHQPDIILLDLGLPDLDGQTVAGLLRSMPHLAHVPVVAVTAWPPDTARQMAKAYGCNGFISKPISLGEFPSQVAAYLNPAAWSHQSNHNLHTLQ
jgi:two-component system cell cycle response regulator DivK